MKSYIYILLIIFSVSLVYSQPKIEILEGTSFDFGEMLSGAKIDKKLTIKNRGKDTLNIQSVQASCGCTAALLSANVIPPGNTGSLSIGFDSKGFDGKVHKTVTIYSNDTSKSQLLITFTANITSILKFDPQMIYFQNLTLDTTATMKLKVRNNTNESVEIVSFDHKIQGLQIDIMQRKLMPNEITEMSLKFNPNTQGMSQGEIVVNTKNKKQPKIPLRFFAFVK